jgi:hypothetical protein
MAKKQTGPRAKGNLVKELDAAIALLTRVRALAVAGETEETASPKKTKTIASKKTVKRVLSTSAREAIAAAQKKRWAKVRRQKKQAERAALAK